MTLGESHHTKIRQGYEADEQEEYEPEPEEEENLFDNVICGQETEMGSESVTVSEVKVGKI